MEGWSWAPGPNLWVLRAGAQSLGHLRCLKQLQTTLRVLQMSKLRDDLWQAHNLVVIPTLLHSSCGKRNLTPWLFTPRCPGD